MNIFKIFYSKCSVETALEAKSLSVRVDRWVNSYRYQILDTRHFLQKAEIWEELVQKKSYKINN